MLGITLPFNQISDQYLNLPISYIQILFQNKKDWLDPSFNDLKRLNKVLMTRNIRPIIHINVQICVVNLTGNYLSRVKQELQYAKELNAQYIVIHCGTKGRKKPIPIDVFRSSSSGMRPQQR